MPILAIKRCVFVFPCVFVKERERAKKDVETKVALPS